MSQFHSPRIVTDGLILMLDAANGESFRGEPTTNLISSPTMTPTNSTSEILSTSTVQSNVGGSGWSWTYFPDSNISADGGMIWSPNEPDPLGGKGVWIMKKRAGGNSESQFAVGSAPGAIDTNSTYTLSVYCKATVANTARIHINVTLNGQSNWGYASNTHTGDGTWQRLTLTIPAGVGVTSINVVRCQSLGTSINTNIYWKYFQIEAKSYATPFVNGTRGTTVATGGGWADLSGNSNNGELINGTIFSSGNMGGILFDGIDDRVDISNSAASQFPHNLPWTFSLFGRIVSQNTTFPGFLIKGSASGSGVLFFYTSGVTNFYIKHNNIQPGISVSTTQPFNVTWSHNGSGTTRIYLNGNYILNGPTMVSTDTSNNLLLGRGDAFGNVLIYNFSKYNRQLTDTEILQNYNANKGRFGL